jgi:hypothetical protein
MNKLPIVLFLSLLWTGSASGQVEQEVNAILKTKDFVKFKAFTDSLTDRNEGIAGHWTILRDLAGDFREGVFSFERSVPDSENEAVSTIYRFSVNVIMTETTLVYYELAAIKNKRSEDGWVPYRDPIDRFHDEQALADLNAAFKAIFLTDLDEQALFTEGPVYGKRCGNIGIDTEGRQQLNKMVARKDKAALVKWLQSGNTEKQVYAVDGLYQLKELGVQLTAEELRMIHYVSNKKGTVHICFGCIHDREEIRIVTEQFDF